MATTSEGLAYEGSSVDQTCIDRGDLLAARERAVNGKPEDRKVNMLAVDRLLDLMLKGRPQISESDACM